MVYRTCMLSGIRVFSSDLVWRGILSDLNATVLDAPNVIDVNMDALDLRLPVSVMELKSAILSATDNSKIINQIFLRPIQMPELHRQIIALLYKTGGMTASELKVAMGYSPNAATHTVDTVIYQLRRAYGHEFIENEHGKYKIGRI